MALKDIRGIVSGDSTVMATSDFEKLYDSEKSLQKQMAKTSRMIENRNAKIADMNAELITLRRELRSATSAASRAEAKTEYVKTRTFVNRKKLSLNLQKKRRSR